MFAKQSVYVKGVPSRTKLPTTGTLTKTKSKISVRKKQSRGNLSVTGSSVPPSASDSKPNLVTGKDEIENEKVKLVFANRKEKESIEKELVEVAADDMGRFDTNVDNLFYFHGFLAREEAESLMSDEGDFLIRETEINGLNTYVISVQKAEKCHHCLVRTTKTKKLYWTSKYAFKSIVELTIYHSRNGIPIYKDLVLVKGVGKQGWQINHEQIDLKTKLGEGQFGQVWRGVMKTRVTESGIPVAVKKLTGLHLSGKQKSEFLQEARLMLALQHCNVARLYGICSMRQPVMLVLEFCELGALDSMLKSSKKVSSPQKIVFLYQAACGLQYIHEKKIIHRDIAARNCLVNKKMVLKIADFGLSHKGLAITERKGGNTPYKYMAPEAIKPGRHSPASDMFSYTALMYEMMTDGQVPFEDEKNRRLPIKELVKRLRDFKIHLEFNPPADTPACVTRIFDSCRVKDPDQRLTAQQVARIFEEEAHCVEVRPETWMQKKREQILTFLRNL